MPGEASLIVPGFNGGNPIALTEFDFSASLRSVAGRSGRLADWTGQFALPSDAMAAALNEHLDHTFEEGHSAVSEIIEAADGARFKFDGVALRHRGGARYAFTAHSRDRL
jgi:hypothetical protein